MSIDYKTFKRLYTTGTPSGDMPEIGQTRLGSAFAKKDMRELDSIRYRKKRVILISPFMAEDYSLAPRMERYALHAVRDSVNRGEAPLAANLFFYMSIDVTSKIERDIGLHAALTWIKGCELVAAYVDHGVTPAMQAALNVAESRSKKIEFRSIGDIG